MAVIAAVNFRGVGESVKVNVLLTCVELSGLLIIIVIGLWAIGAATAISRAPRPSTPRGRQRRSGAVIAATTLAFFAMVGFEDSVNMAEETQGPGPDLPQGAADRPRAHRLIYVLVVDLGDRPGPPEELGEGDTPLLKVVQAGAPGFPLGDLRFITMFAVANSALINMLMASRLIYGMSREHVLPPLLGKVHPTRRTPYIAIGFTTLLAFALITVRRRGAGARRHHRAAAAVRVHRREHRGPGAAQGHGGAQASGSRSAWLTAGRPRWPTSRAS